MSDPPPKSRLLHLRLPSVADWLWANPVVQREWTRRPVAGPLRRAGVVLGTAAVVLLHVGAALWLTHSGTTDWQARLFLLALCEGYLVLVTLVVPGRAAAAISGEKERETLQALLLTSLRPSQVAVGKLVAALRPAGEALVVIGPLLAMGIHASRLPIGQALPLLLVLVVAPLPVAAGGLWLSGRSRRTMVATALAYLITGSLYWAVLAWSPLPEGDNTGWFCSAGWHAMVLCFGAPPEGGIPEWSAFAGIALLLTWLWLSLVTRRLGATER
jgi:hypothetical protein